MSDLNITEIYDSIQGEASYAGYSCLFIRLATCPLRCRWCDTVYSFKQGEVWSIDKILERAQASQSETVELTGGEPLAQQGCKELIVQLLGLSKFKRIMIETSGAFSIQGLPAELHIIMDIKCPDSGMSEKNLWSNLKHLKTSDEIKFVIASRSDFEWSLAVIEKHSLKSKAKLLFSPAFGLVKEKQLAEWIINEAPFTRLNLQQHKYIWPPRTRGV